MAGLLELLGAGTGDPKRDAALNQGILQAGLSLLSSNQPFRQALGQAGMAGLQGQRLTQEQQYQQEQRKREEDAYKRQQAMQNLAQQYYRTPEQTALAGGGGPTNANAAKIAGPSFNSAGYAQALAQYDPMAAVAYQQATAKDNSPLITKEGDVARDRRDPTKILWSNPKAETGQPELQKLMALRNMYPAGSQERANVDAAIKKMTTHSPGVNVSVNTGKEGIKNEMALRGDFRAEPIYKAHQEVQSAYSQIKQSLRQMSPAGDLAGATKIMKLLDPGSVVRESELGMAMQASGAMDRLINYAGNVVNGTKLTPTQRKDFMTLADALYGESAKQYNSKRSEYEGFASDYGLNPKRVAGDPAMPSTPSADGWSITPVK